MIPSTMLSDSANHHSPHRTTTTVENPSSNPTPTPQQSTTPTWDRALVNAGRISGGPGRAMANANTASRKKVAAVMATTPSMRGIRTGPRIKRKVAPCSTCSFRSSMAAQIHMAGSTWIKVSRQLDRSSRRPWKSIARAPTARARGARMRRRRLSWTTMASTMASSPSRILRMSSPACLQKPVAVGRAGGPMSGALSAATSWPAPLDAAGIPFTCSSGMAAWPALSPSQNPRGVSYPASPLREAGTNGACGDAARRDGSSLLMNPVTRRHGPGKAPGRVSRPHPSRV